jgi:YgiT-type zinc finger domain-containing protein
MSELCSNCGKAGVTERRMTRSYGKGNSLIVIEGVPVISCPNCGVSYLSARTLHEIDRIKRLRKSVAVSREIPVATFADPVP